MRSLRRRNRGLSEIVGTLILVLIVVSAATLLAAFIAAYQKQLLTEESFSHDQSLESIKILSLVTALNSERTAYENINFTLGSEYINPSGVLSISIDNVPLSFYWCENLDNHSWQRIALGTTLTLEPQEEVYISTNTSSLNNSFLSSAPLPNQYLKFDVYTLLQNDFNRVFVPPVALAVVSNMTLSPTSWVTLLDGTQSFQPGGNATIVAWNWSVTSFSAPGKPAYYLGEEVQALLFPTGQKYWVNLTVSNSNGLTGTTNVIATGGP